MQDHCDQNYALQPFPGSENTVFLGNSVNCMIERESCIKPHTVTEWEVNEVHLTDQWCKPVIRLLVQLPEGLSKSGNLNRY